MKLHTVSGPLDAECIGSTMIHEHLVFDLSGVRNDTDSSLAVSDVMEESIALKQAGCDLVVEVSNIGMGRDPLGLRTISEQTNMAIIASTGFYKEIHYPSYVFERTSQALAEILVADILVGMDGTNIKAGLIAEIGSSLNEITSAEQKVFYASILAHKATGAPISTHCEIGTMGREQLKLFQDCDVDMSRISFGHQDLNLNMAEQVELMNSGAYIQFDTIGKQSYRSDLERALNLIRLLDMGYVRQIMLSCDITRKSHLQHNGGYGYIHLFNSFIPLLKNHGVTDDMIKQMLVDNPKQFLAF